MSEELRAALTQANLETVVHILGCPRWQQTPAEECEYRRIHVEDAEKRGPALRAALSQPRQEDGLDGSCEKCGAIGASTAWHQTEFDCSFNQRRLGVRGEHLHRVCRNCRYHWTQPVLTASEG